MYSLKNKGFSLPELTVALGILGGIALVTVKLIENNANNQAHLKAKSEIQKTTALLKSILNNSESCRNMLKDQVLPIDNQTTTSYTTIGNPPALPAGSTTPTFPVAGGLYQRISIPVPPLAPPKYAYKEILINNANYGLFRIAPNGIQLRKLTHAGISKMDGTNNSVDNIEMIITFRMETKSIMFRSDNNDANDATYIERIPLTVTYDNTSRRINNCGLTVSDATIAAKKKFCESLGNMGEWKDALNKCLLKETKCDPGFVPEQQNAAASSKLFKCVPVSEQFNALDLFDTSTTGCVSTTGRYTVVSNGGTPPKLTIHCL